MNMLLGIVKLATALVPGKSRRRLVRRKVRSFLWGWQARHYGAVEETVEFTGRTKINRKTSIGANSVVCGLTVSGDGAVTIGRNCELAPEILILTQNHDYDDGCWIPYGHESREKPVVIEDFVWIGQRVTLLPGTVIREGAIVQAGAVVHGEIPVGAIAGGNPAKPFASRDMARFLKLKGEGAYRGA